MPSNPETTEADVRLRAVKMLAAEAKTFAIEADRIFAACDYGMRTYYMNKAAKSLREESST